VADKARRTERAVPVVIGSNYKHIMGHAVISREPDKVLIEISAVGLNGQMLAEFLEQAEPIAVMITAIPVQNTRERRETT